MNSSLDKQQFIKLVNIFEEDAGTTTKYWSQYNNFFIESEFNELMIRVDNYSKELTIARIRVQKQRNGVATKTLNFLKQYAKENGFGKIIIELALTEEIKSFALKNRFKKQSGNYNYNYELQKNEF
ncbi:hypothetical protein MZM54_04950 [[Brevibacterium] frigoritolerans]|nr:hypothetical protein [Peribacillus frigoritolerans]